MPEGRLQRTREAYGSEQPPQGRCVCGAMPGEPHAPECFWNRAAVKDAISRTTVRGVDEPTAETPWAI